MLEHEFSHTINDVSSPDATLLTYDKPLHVTAYRLIGSLVMSIFGLLHYDKLHIRLACHPVFLTHLHGTITNPFCVARLLPSLARSFRLLQQT